MKLHFVTASGSVAILGTFAKVTREDLRRYVRNFPLAWVAA